MHLNHHFSRKTTSFMLTLKDKSGKVDVVARTNIALDIYLWFHFEQFYGMRCSTVEPTKKREINTFWW